MPLIDYNEIKVFTNCGQNSRTVTRRRFVRIERRLADVSKGLMGAHQNSAVDLIAAKMLCDTARVPRKKLLHVDIFERPSERSASPVNNAAPLTSYPRCDQNR